MSACAGLVCRLQIELGLGYVGFFVFSRDSSGIVGGKFGLVRWTQHAESPGPHEVLGGDAAGPDDEPSLEQIS